MRLFRRKSGAVVEDIPAAVSDPLAEAYTAMKEAQLAFNKASVEKQAYERQSLNYGWRIINEQRVFLNNDDPVRLAFNLKAARRWDDWQRKIKIWSDLDRAAQPESIYAAGIRIR
jgi:hypothetical protein